jgi:hypothetical protein
LFVLRNENGKLRLLVRQEWRSIVPGEDVDYIQSLFQDFLNRANLHPEALFKQLSSLGVGPLRTQDVELSIDDYALIQKQISGFVELKHENSPVS